MGNLILELGKVKEIENINSKFINDEKHKFDRPYDGLRIRAEIPGKDHPSDGEKEYIPWAFPLLPKSFQTIPKEGEAVLILHEDGNNTQRYYIGPIISQPQFNSFSDKKNATSLLRANESAPLERISDNANTKGSFPKPSDVAVIGRGKEDILLRYNDETEESEIQLRSGIRNKLSDKSNPNMKGNIMFNKEDPAYVQIKYKKNLATEKDHEANSVINMVANRVNIMSNKDDTIAHNLNDQDDMIKAKKMDEIMDDLHQVPMGDKLVELLKIMKGCIMHHVHPWAGMEQCGDWSGYINKLEGYDIDSILSKYVRIS